MVSDIGVIDGKHRQRVVESNQNFEITKLLGVINEIF